MKYSLGKEERLKSRKLTEQLFRSGKSFTVFPIRTYYQFNDIADRKFPVQAGVSASGKIFRKAVQRNRIKRLLRETYRLQKNKLYEACEENKKQLSLFFVYIDKTLPEYEPLKEKMSLILEKLSDLVRENRA